MAATAANELPIFNAPQADFTIANTGSQQLAITAPGNGIPITQGIAENSTPQIGSCKVYIVQPRSSCIGPARASGQKNPCPEAAGWPAPTD